MPELPEVETIRTDVEKHLLGAGISGVEVLDERLVEHPESPRFAGRMAGNSIVGARRRAKYLILDLATGDSLALQLKIGGQFLLVPPAEEPTTDLMLRLDLRDGRRVFLRDETTYTRAQLYTPEELELRLQDLGPEPFSEGFTVEYLKGRIGGRRAQIKPLLLDQKIVSGVGNIYVDETLFDARIHPKRKASSLSGDEWQRLYGAVVGNLQAGVDHRGTTFSLYRDLLGKKGRHQDHLKVFLRAGKECEGCGGVVARVTVGGRATFICPVCQVEDGEASGGDGVDGSGGAEQLELL